MKKVEEKSLVAFVVVFFLLLFLNVLVSNYAISRIGPKTSV